MNKLLTVGLLLLVAGTSQAKDQRENCNQKASSAASDERSQIIEACIRRNASVTNMPPMLARMSQCNREAGEMSGENRVRFVNTCLQRPD
ncbi:MAG: PsiF family protein [Pseudomonadota bacterium]